MCFCVVQIFTALPPLALGLMDQDVSSETRMKLPRLYKTSQNGREFNAKVCGVWLTHAVFTILCYVCVDSLGVDIEFYFSLTCAIFYNITCIVAR